MVTQCQRVSFQKGQSRACHGLVRNPMETLVLPVKNYEHVIFRISQALCLQGKRQS